MRVASVRNVVCSKCEPNSARCASLQSSTTLIFLFRPFSRALIPQPRGCELRILLSSPFGIARKITAWDQGPIRPSVRRPSDRSIDRPIYLAGRSGWRSGINLLSAVREVPSGEARDDRIPLCENTSCIRVLPIVRLPDISGWHY